MRNNIKNASKVLSCVLTLSLSASSGVFDVEAKAKELNDSAAKKEDLVQKIKAAAKNEDYFNSLNEEETVRVIVQLKDPSAMDIVKTKGKDLDVKKLQNVDEKIKKSQKGIKSQAEKITGEKVESQFGTLINGFSINAKIADIKKLQKIDGVKNIKIAKKYYPAMNSAGEITQAPRVWEDLSFKGEGTVVSIIDSGIDSTHKDFRLSKEESAKIKKFSGNKGPGKYYTSKVPYGYNFADKNDDIIDKNPTVNMHGMHVAGIVAANSSKEDIEANNGIKGVAPEAQVLAMKVFSNNPDVRGAGEDDIVSAIEESVKQGADVINMSLGSTAGFVNEEDPEQEAIKKAVDAGTIVVVAAGNEQYSTAPYKIDNIKDTGLVGSPGTAEDAITVANIQNSKITMTAMQIKNDSIDEKIPYMESGKILMKDTLDKDKNYAVVDCGLGKVEDFEGKDLKDKIALIKRGEINFTDKKLNAQKAGAIASIVYNADGDQSFLSMASDPGEKIPSVFLRSSDGLKIKENIEKNISASFKGESIVIDNINAGDFTKSTSWGPTPNLDFKPQISAPGGDIFSTVNGNKYSVKTGTSMASPHVAGGEALMVQAVKKQNPNLKGRDLVNFIKNTSINTSKIMFDKQNSDTPYSPRRQGAGVIQIEDAINNKVIVTDSNNNPTVALKQIGNQTTFELTLKNYGDSDAAYTVENVGGVLIETSENLNDRMSYDTKLGDAKVEFDKTEIVVPKNGETKVNVTLNISDKVLKDNFIEGFIKFNGKDIPSLSVPFVGFYGEWGKEQIIDSMAWDEDNRKFVVPSNVLSNVNGEFGYELGLSDIDKRGYAVTNPKTIAISPNGDGNYDKVVPYLYYLRNARYTRAEVLDKDKNVLSVLGNSEFIRKEQFQVADGSGKRPDVFEDLGWDGTIYDKTTGENKVLPEGQYYLRLNSKIDYEDANEQILDIPVNIDLTAPKIELLSSKNVKSNKNKSETEYKLEFKVSDNVGLSTIEPMVRINGKILNDELEEKDGVYSCNVNLQNERLNNIEITTIDTSMNTVKYSDVIKVEGEKATISFLEDFTKKQINVKDSEEYIIRGTALGNIGEFKINNEDVKCNEIGEFNHKVSLKQGVNHISVYAKDKEGNELINYPGKILCDTIKPVITLKSPMLNSDGVVATNKNTINVSGTVEDNTLGYKFYVNNELKFENFIAAKASGDVNRKEFNYDIPVKDGEMVKLKAVDVLNNEKEIKILVKEDKDAPVFTLDGIVDGGIYNHDIIPTIKVDDKDATVSYNLDGKEYDGKTKITNEGKHHLEIMATDKASNKTEIELNFTIDKTKPAISISGIENNKTYNKTIIPTIKVDDEKAKVSYALNGMEYDGKSNISKDGTYELTVTAQDEASNTSTEKITFIINSVINESDDIFKVVEDKITNNKDQKEFNFDLKGSKIIPKEVFEFLKDKEKKVNFKINEEGKEYTWIFNSKDIKDFNEDVDLSIDKCENENVKKLDKDAYMFKLKNKGKLPENTNIILPLNKEYDVSKPSNLYSVEDDKEPILEEESIAIKEDGEKFVANIKPKKGGEYFISNKDKKEIIKDKSEDTKKEDDKNDGEEKIINDDKSQNGNVDKMNMTNSSNSASGDVLKGLPKTGAAIGGGILSGIGAVITLIGVSLVNKKKK